MRSTIVKPSNGQSNKNKPKGKAKNRSSGLGLRRLTKRQKERIYRIFTIIFLIVFAVTIVGAMFFMVSQKVPGQ
ncbi:MAG: hypothetical protein M3Z41_01250 [Candidatus Eremiobacteraeota bacterium]|nr:hypothetical protein [Candidatus Eremiobacteraeota bacterium]